MKLLLTGGAGFIGSHMALYLKERGHEVVVFDNLSHGHSDAVLDGTLVAGDLSDTATLDAVFRQNKFDGVVHFASYIEVGESVNNPLKYYENNVGNTLNLLKAMQAHGVRRFIFSSSAAVYGEPQYVPIDEKHAKAPLNPYGRSKWMVEQFLEDFDHAYGLASIALRYFNAAGADPAGRLGERHDPESHLIPLVLKVAAGVLPSIKIFGQDYDTHDGTCIRDYIHVNDLCEAHLLALQNLMDGGTSDAFNLGNGNGFSVQEVIDTARKVTGREIPAIVAPRRQGDPARLIADSTRAIKELGWHPRFAALEQIIGDAWNWESRKLLSSIKKKIA